MTGNTPSQEKLPRNPDWTLTAVSPDFRRLSLHHGRAELHLRFWPRASAALRLGPEGCWLDGGRQAGRLLRRFLKRTDCSRRRIRGRTCYIDAGGQLHFPALFQGSDLPEPLRLDQALLAALGTIPIPVRSALRSLPAKQWGALQLASRIRASAELLTDHPQLFWLWLRRYRLTPPDPGQSRRLPCLATDLQPPRHTQLGKLGFSTDKFWLRVLRKIDLRQLHTIDWEAFASLTRAKLHPDLRKHLQHCVCLTAPLLRALADPRLRRHVNAALLRSYLKHPRCDLAAMLAVYDRFQREFPGAKEHVKPPASISQLDRMREDMAAALDDHYSYRHDKAESPFACPEGWTHLGDIPSLVEEGFRQRNCLRRSPGTYLEDDGFLYRVEEPVRATVQLRKSEEGCWYVAQCLGRENEPLPPETSRELLHVLTGRPMPDLKRLERKAFPPGPAPSTCAYQQLTNTRALWALHATDRIRFLPDRMVPALLGGDRAIYRVGTPDPCVIELRRDKNGQWEGGRIFHKSNPVPSVTPFLVATHILWHHHATLRDRGFEAPRWKVPALDLPDYRPVGDLWELMRFLWDTGDSVTLKDLRNGSLLAFHCRIGNRRLAVVAEPLGDACRLRYYTRTPTILSRLDPEAESIEQNIIDAIADAGDPHGPNPAPTRFQPPPALPALKEAIRLNRTDYALVTYPD